MTARTHFLSTLAISLAASLVGFAVEATAAPTAGPGDAPLTRARIGTIKLPAPKPKPAPPPMTRTWSQSDPQPILLGPVSDWFCFLTAVSGKFAGGGESVYVSQSDDHWWLTGSSQQIDVSATAMCIPRNWRGQKLEISDEYTWTQSNPAPKKMGSADGRVCFLTRVTGKFEGGGERVRTYKEQGSWWLGGNSFQRDVAARARCVNTTQQSGGFLWKQGEDSKPMEAAPWACGLTGMHGRFYGGGERVAIEERDGKWHLGGRSQQRDVIAEAHCM